MALELLPICGVETCACPIRLPVVSTNGQVYSGPAAHRCPEVPVASEVLTRTLGSVKHEHQPERNRLRTRAPPCTTDCSGNSVVSKLAS